MATKSGVLKDALQGGGRSMFGNARLENYYTEMERSDNKEFSNFRRNKEAFNTQARNELMRGRAIDPYDPSANMPSKAQITNMATANYQSSLLEKLVKNSRDPKFQKETLEYRTKHLAILADMSVKLDKIIANTTKTPKQVQEEKQEKERQASTLAQNIAQLNVGGVLNDIKTVLLKNSDSSGFGGLIKSVGDMLIGQIKDGELGKTVSGFMRDAAMKSVLGNKRYAQYEDFKTDPVMFIQDIINKLSFDSNRQLANFSRNFFVGHGKFEGSKRNLQDPKAETFWTVEDHITLTKVIPGHLAGIEAALRGVGHTNVYDMEEQRWVAQGSMVKKDMDRQKTASLDTEAKELSRPVLERIVEMLDAHDNERINHSSHMNIYRELFRSTDDGKIMRDANGKAMLRNEHLFEQLMGNFIKNADKISFGATSGKDFDVHAAMKHGGLRWDLNNQAEGIMMLKMINAALTHNDGETYDFDKELDERVAAAIKRLNTNRKTNQTSYAFGRFEDSVLTTIKDGLDGSVSPADLARSLKDKTGLKLTGSTINGDEAIKENTSALEDNTYALYALTSSIGSIDRGSGNNRRRRGGRGGGNNPPVPPNSPPTPPIPPNNRRNGRNPNNRGTLMDLFNNGGQHITAKELIEVYGLDAYSARNLINQILGSDGSRRTNRGDYRIQNANAKVNKRLIGGDNYGYEKISDSTKVTKRHSDFTAAETELIEKAGYGMLFNTNDESVRTLLKDVVSTGESGAAKERLSVQDRARLYKARKAMQLESKAIEVFAELSAAGMTCEAAIRDGLATSVGEAKAIGFVESPNELIRQRVVYWDNSIAQRDSHKNGATVDYSALRNISSRYNNKVIEDVQRLSRINRTGKGLSFDIASPTESMSKAMNEIFGDPKILRAAGVGSGGAIGAAFGKLLNNKGIISSPKAPWILGMIGAGIGATEWAQRSMGAILGPEGSIKNANGYTNRQIFMAKIFGKWLPRIGLGGFIGKNTMKFFNLFGPYGKVVGIPAAIVTSLIGGAMAGPLRKVASRLLFGKEGETADDRKKMGFFRRFFRGIGDMVRDTELGTIIGAPKQAANGKKVANKVLSDYEKKLDAVENETRTALSHVRDNPELQERYNRQLELIAQAKEGIANAKQNIDNLNDEDDNVDTQAQNILQRTVDNLRDSGVISLEHSQTIMKSFDEGIEFSGSRVSAVDDKIDFNIHNKQVSRNATSKASDYITRNDAIEQQLASGDVDSTTRRQLLAELDENNKIIEFLDKMKEGAEDGKVNFKKLLEETAMGEHVNDLVDALKDKKDLISDSYESKEGFFEQYLSGNAVQDVQNDIRDRRSNDAFETMARSLQGNRDELRNVLDIIQTEMKFQQAVEGVRKVAELYVETRWGDRTVQIKNKMIGYIMTSVRNSAELRANFSSENFQAVMSKIMAKLEAGIEGDNIDDLIKEMNNSESKISYMVKGLSNENREHIQNMIENLNNGTASTPEDVAAMVNNIRRDTERPAEESEGGAGLSRRRIFGGGTLSSKNTAYDNASDEDPTKGMKLMSDFSKFKLSTGESLSTAGCSIVSFNNLLNFLNIPPYSVSTLVEIANKHLTKQGGVTANFFLEIAPDAGLSAQVYNRSNNKFTKANVSALKPQKGSSGFICLLQVAENNPTGHFVLVTDINSKTVTIHDPEKGPIKNYPLTDFVHRLEEVIHFKVVSEAKTLNVTDKAEDTSSSTVKGKKQRKSRKQIIKDAFMGALENDPMFKAAKTLFNTGKNVVSFFTPDNIKDKLADGKAAITSMFGKAKEKYNGVIDYIDQKKENFKNGVSNAAEQVRDLVINRDKKKEVMDVRIVEDLTLPVTMSDQGLATKYAQKIQSSEGTGKGFTLSQGIKNMKSIITSPESKKEKKESQGVQDNLLKLTGSIVSGKGGKGTGSTEISKKKEDKMGFFAKLMSIAAPILFFKFLPKLIDMLPEPLKKKINELTGGMLDMFGAGGAGGPFNPNQKVAPGDFTPPKPDPKKKKWYEKGITGYFYNGIKDTFNTGRDTKRLITNDGLPENLAHTTDIYDSKGNLVTRGTADEEISTATKIPHEASRAARFVMTARPILGVAFKGAGMAMNGISKAVSFVNPASYLKKAAVAGWKSWRSGGTLTFGQAFKDQFAKGSTIGNFTKGIGNFLLKPKEGMKHFLNETKLGGVVKVVGKGTAAVAGFLAKLVAKFTKFLAWGLPKFVIKFLWWIVKLLGSLSGSESLATAFKNFEDLVGGWKDKIAAKFSSWGQSIKGFFTGRGASKAAEKATSEAGKGFLSKFAGFFSSKFGKMVAKSLKLGALSGAITALGTLFSLPKVWSNCADVYHWDERTKGEIPFVDKVLLTFWRWSWGATPGLIRGVVTAITTILAELLADGVTALLALFPPLLAAGPWVRLFLKTITTLGAMWVTEKIMDRIQEWWSKKHPWIDWLKKHILTSDRLGKYAQAYLDGSKILQDKRTKGQATITYNGATQEDHDKIEQAKKDGKKIAEAENKRAKAKEAKLKQAHKYNSRPTSKPSNAAVTAITTAKNPEVKKKDSSDIKSSYRKVQSYNKGSSSSTGASGAIGNGGTIRGGAAAAAYGTSNDPVVQGAADQAKYEQQQIDQRNRLAAQDANQMNNIANRATVANGAMAYPGLQSVDGNNLPTVADYTGSAPPGEKNIDQNLFANSEAWNQLLHISKEDKDRARAVGTDPSINPGAMNEAIARTLKLEGGEIIDEGDGKGKEVSQYGVTYQEAARVLSRLGYGPASHDYWKQKIRAHAITKDMAAKYYEVLYKEMKSEFRLSGKAHEIAFDLYVNSGRGAVYEMLKFAGFTEDWRKMLIYRRNKYRSITARNKGKGKYAKGWQTRITKLEAALRRLPDGRYSLSGPDMKSDPILVRGRGDLGVEPLSAAEMARQNAEMAKYGNSINPVANGGYNDPERRGVYTQQAYNIARQQNISVQAAQMQLDRQAAIQNYNYQVNSGGNVNQQEIYKHDEYFQANGQGVKMSNVNSLDINSMKQYRNSKIDQYPTDGLHYAASGNLALLYGNWSPSGTNYINPITGQPGMDGPYSITSPPGSRHVSGGSKVHMGVDIVPDRPHARFTRHMIPVYSAADGVIETINNRWGAVTVKHSNGMKFRYMHLFKDSYARLKEGDRVRAGQILGNMGGRGAGNDDKFGRHLHLEIETNRKTPDGKPVMIDPIKEMRISLGSRQIRPNSSTYKKWVQVHRNDLNYGYSSARGGDDGGAKAYNDSMNSAMNDAGREYQRKNGKKASGAGYIAARTKAMLAYQEKNKKPVKPVSAGQKAKTSNQKAKQDGQNTATQMFKDTVKRGMKSVASGYNKAEKAVTGAVSSAAGWVGKQLFGGGDDKGGPYDFDRAAISPKAAVTPPTSNNFGGYNPNSNYTQLRLNDAPFPTTDMWSDPLIDKLDELCKLQKQMIQMMAQLGNRLTSDQMFRSAEKFSNAERHK